jgi:antagonist of KipI
MKVIKPGVLTTVQDLGRFGLQHFGVVPGGAMDPVALELANALVGNARDAAALELTVLGPELALESDALVALCGAELDAKVDGKPLPADRPVLLRKGSQLATGRALRGSRAYLAVAGGIEAPAILGSRSTYLPAGFGGLQGRALRAGDALPLAPEAATLALKRYLKISGRKKAGPAGMSTVRWSAPAPTLPDGERVLVHAMEGRHFAHFDTAAQRAFFGETWKVSPDSNRMGFRLAGPSLAPTNEGKPGVEILSEPTCLGTVQVPSGGQPIVLMADHQTTGGYPKIAEIAGADVPRLAQLAPGGSVQFARCTLEEAVALRRALRRRLDSTLRALAWEFGK